MSFWFCFLRNKSLLIHNFLHYLMPQDLGDIKPTSNPGLKGCHPSRRPMVTFPPSPSPKLPGTRRAPSSPGSGPPPPSPSPGQGQTHQAGVATATSLPSSPAEAGGPRREVRRGSGAWVLPGARAQQRGPRQGTSARHSREGVAVRPAGRSAPEGSPSAQGWQTKIKRWTPGPLRPRPRDPLRSVTRTARAGSGFHWWPWRPPGPAHRPRPRRPFPGALVRCAGAPTWPRGRTRDASHQPIATPPTAARFPFLPQRSIVGRNGTETTSRKSETAPCGVARDPRV